MNHRLKIAIIIGTEIKLSPSEGRREFSKYCTIKFPGCSGAVNAIVGDSTKRKNWNFMGVYSGIMRCVKIRGIKKPRNRAEMLTIVFAVVLFRFCCLM